MTKDPKLEVRRYRTGVERHSHDHHQVVLPVDGWMEMTITGQQDLVSAQQAVVIPAEKSHEFAVSPENKFLILDIPSRNVSFSGPSLAQAGEFWSAATKAPFVPLDRAFAQLSSFAASEIGRFGDHWQMQSLSSSLLEALARRMGLPDRPEPPRLKNARHFIELNHAQPLEVAHIAQAAHVSVSRLHALFQEYYGLTPQGYLANHRLRRAEDLLRERQMSIAQIALAVGYQDQSAFTRAFRRVKELTPAAYRRAHAEK